MRNEINVNLVYERVKMCVEAWSFILSGQESSGLSLESDDDHSDLQISLLLQLGEHPCAEEDFTLSDPVQIGVQVQMFDLHKRHQWHEYWSDHRDPFYLKICAYHEAAGLFAIHETFRNCICSQDLISAKRFYI